MSKKEEKLSKECSKLMDQISDLVEQFSKKLKELDELDCRSANKFALIINTYNMYGDKSPLGIIGHGTVTKGLIEELKKKTSIPLGMLDILSQMATEDK